MGKWLAGRTRLIRLAATIALAAFALALILEMVLLARASAPLEAGLRQIAYRLPLLCYLSALWSVRRALSALEHGADPGPVVSRFLNRVGVALALGAAATVAVAPLAVRVLGGWQRGPYLAFDPSAITLGVIGLMLMLVAPVLGEAAAMRAELDEIL